MPSGARKRKAAKKKQEKGTPTTPLSANTSSTTLSTQGDEDLKLHEIDGGHNAEGEEGVDKSTEDVKNGDVGLDKAAGLDDGGVQVEGESKTGDVSDEKKGDSSSSGSSSDSDDGSREVDKNIMIVENAPVIHLVETDDPVGERVSEAGEGNISVQDEKVSMDSGALADNVVVEFGQKDSGEAKLSSLEESGSLPEVANEEEHSRQLDISKEVAPDTGKYDNIDVIETSDATESAVSKNEEKTVFSYNAPRVDTAEDAEHSQAHVTSAIRPDQSTSWKSCCGLFEAFTAAAR